MPEQPEYGYCDLRSTINGPEVVRADEVVLMHDDFTLGAWAASQRLTPQPLGLDGNLLWIRDVVYELVGWDEERGAHIAERVEPAPAKKRSRRA